MPCLAQMVRDLNGQLWLPECDVSASPDLLIEPRSAVDRHESADGSCWVVVYSDGSSLNAYGAVRERAPSAAADCRAAGIPELQAA